MAENPRGLTRRVLEQPDILILYRYENKFVLYPDQMSTLEFLDLELVLPCFLSVCVSYLFVLFYRVNKECGNTIF